MKGQESFSLHSKFFVNWVLLIKFLIVIGWTTHSSKYSDKSDHSYIVFEYILHQWGFTYLVWISHALLEFLSHILTMKAAWWLSWDLWKCQHTLVYTLIHGSTIIDLANSHKTKAQSKAAANLCLSLRRAWNDIPK